MMRAVIFDLDETLLDTSMLRDNRIPGRWGWVFRHLGDVRRYHHDSPVQVHELPGKLASMNYQVGVLTNSPGRYARELLELHNLPYDALVSGSDAVAPKPSPTGLRQLLDELGVNPDEAVLVGDDDRDTGAAAAAGVLSVGVAWSCKAPACWRRHWPDVAIAQPDQLFDLLESPSPMRPFAEAVLAEIQPKWHWGSMAMPGEGVFAAGRYFATSDRRHPHHRLSRLVVESKKSPSAAQRMGELLGKLVVSSRDFRAVDLITTVPPKPESTDRFGPVRKALSDALGVPARGDLVQMNFEVAGYKGMGHDERREANAGRFSAAPFDGEHVLLVDDVITSGSQAECCRSELLLAGASQVTVLGAGLTQDKLPDPCPVCGSDLKTFVSVYGPFQGCTAWFAGQCNFKRDIS